MGGGVSGEAAALPPTSPPPPDDFAAPAWTEERVRLLRHHYRLGLTAQESALLLGGVSRNAIISKRRRLGLTGAVASIPAEPRRARPGPQWRMPRWRREPVFRCEPLPPMDDPPPPQAQPRPLASRDAGQCLWPLGPSEAPGDWRTLFCCAPVAAAGSYCPAHRARSRR